MKAAYGLLVLALSAPNAFAHGSNILGRNLAATCANCHGTDGHSVGSVASLAGQSAETLTTKLNEFKQGTRPATIMQQIAKGLTQEQVAAVAAYFAHQR